MQLPINKHKFPEQSLTYTLITTLNEMPAEAIELAKNYTQKRCSQLRQINIVNGYRNIYVLEKAVKTLAFGFVKSKCILKRQQSSKLKCHFLSFH